MESLWKGDSGISRIPTDEIHSTGEVVGGCRHVRRKSFLLKYDASCEVHQPRAGKRGFGSLVTQIRSSSRGFAQESRLPEIVLREKRRVHRVLKKMRTLIIGEYPASFRAASYILLCTRSQESACEPSRSQEKLHAIIVNSLT